MRVIVTGKAVLENDFDVNIVSSCNVWSQGCSPKQRRTLYRITVTSICPTAKHTEAHGSAKACSATRISPRPTSHELGRAPAGFVRRCYAMYKAVASSQLQTRYTPRCDSRTSRSHLVIMKHCLQQRLGAKRAI